MASADANPASVHRVSIASARVWRSANSSDSRNVERLVRHERVDVVVGHHHLVAQRVDERDRDRVPAAG